VSKSRLPTRESLIGLSLLCLPPAPHDDTGSKKVLILHIAPWTYFRCQLLLRQGCIRLATSPLLRTGASFHCSRMKQKKPRSKSRQQSAIPGYLCFSLNPGAQNQRATYSDGRREQVNEIRKLGACLRCQLLKKPVMCMLTLTHSPETNHILFFSASSAPMAILVIDVFEWLPKTAHHGACLGWNVSVLVYPRYPFINLVGTFNLSLIVF
jgi:hypothetical protein